MAAALAEMSADESDEDDVELSSMFGSDFVKHVSANGSVVWKRAPVTAVGEDDAIAEPVYNDVVSVATTARHVMPSCSIEASDSQHVPIASPPSPTIVSQKRPPPLQQKSVKSSQVPLRVYSRDKQPPQQQQHASRALAPQLDAQAVTR